MWKTIYSFLKLRDEQPNVTHSYMLLLDLQIFLGFLGLLDIFGIILSTQLN